MEKSAEKDLLAKMANGSESAFSTIYCKYKPALVSFIKSLIKLDDVAEDLTQQVFLSVWLNRRDINPELSFSSYLFTIAKNNTLNFIRKENNNRRYLKDRIWDEMLFGRSYTDETIEHDELLKTLKEAIDLLTDQKKKIFEMSRKQGLTHEQIAKELKISKNTVKNHMVDSVAFIKKYISSKESLGPGTVILLLWLFS